MVCKSHVFLVGPMGVGKTTIGRLLAEELGIGFVDTDREIEARTGADIPWIFDVEGEAGFRRREADVLQAITLDTPTVFATGGGIVLLEENRHCLHERGLVIYLTAGVNSLLERTGRDKKRPLLQGGDAAVILQDIVQLRDPIYREVADFIIGTENHSPRQVAKDIAAWVRSQQSNAEKNCC